MLTITGIISYRTRKPQPTKALTDAEKNRERRAKAREEGKCGVCASRRPQPGFKTCDPCLSKE